MIFNVLANIVPEMRMYNVLLPVWVIVKFPCMVVVPAAPIKATGEVIVEGLKVKFPKVCPTKFIKTVWVVYDPVIFRFDPAAQVVEVLPSGNVAEEVA